VDLFSRPGQEPVVFDRSLGQWFVFAYDDVAAALADPRLTIDRMHGFADRAPRAAVDALHEHVAWMIDPEGDDFDWVRPALQAGLREAVGAGAQRSIAAAARELLDGLIDGGSFDVAGDYAVVLSGHVLADLLGADRADGPRLMAWAQDLVAFFDDLEIRVETTERMARSAAEAVALAHELLARERGPRGGFLELIARSAAATGRTPGDEVLGNLVLPVLIGEVPVAQLVANTVWLLLEHDDQRVRIATDPSLLASAIEETLRYLPPGPLAGRIALEPFDLRGHRVDAGQVVQLSLVAANRDPARFPDPGRFDVGRRQGAVLTFGHGPHACLGARLARMQAATAIGALLEGAPSLEPDGDRDVAWSTLPGLLGPRALPIRVTAGRAARRAR
jgi:cytochrome P450